MIDCCVVKLCGGMIIDMVYSNKVFLFGIVFWEWCFEEVFGVGGFGIVYKGCGIYFDELVVIKEYFFSVISDCKDGDIVVLIDFVVEEVYVFGFKKFVEEVKFFWNLLMFLCYFNIVSVCSLFEIYGMVYMVMDFEDGMLLFKIFK